MADLNVKDEVVENVKDYLDKIESNVMSSLKDFQRATVERVCRLFGENVNRVLVSDEVGLGKTLIARGTIVKFAQLRKREGDDLVKVVYVCSNSAIAEQNINKLKIDDNIATEKMTDSRLSMQHLKIAMQECNGELRKRYIQLIPLTPQTSFRVSNSEGTAGERALMFAVLKRISRFKKYEDKLAKLMKSRVGDAWDGCADYYEKEVDKCDKESGGKYLKDICSAVERGLDETPRTGERTLFEATERYLKGESGVSKTSVIVGLRTLFAKISIERLNPDLVIMDEFQRFRELLSADKDSETGMLARKFFGSKNARVLLLSATPYKMYSTLDEIDETNSDEHYTEFFDVVGFLNADKAEDEKFREIWSDYSVQLKEFARGNVAALQLKERAENALYRHICRTERIEASGAADIVNDLAEKGGLTVTEGDVRSYVKLHKLLGGTVGYSVPTDYVKSCPYLLSFMRDYKLKRDLEAYFKSHTDEIGKLDRDTFFIKKKSVADYRKIPFNNARLEDVAKRAMPEGAEKLLWITPSKPYYAPAAPFDKAENFSKTLVFSSWEMVPRMIASLLSYEAERKTIGALAKKQKHAAGYFADERRRFPSPKLNFSLKDGEPAAMSLFCLLYPSRFLSGCFDPIDCLNNRRSPEDIVREAKRKIEAALSAYADPCDGAEDRRWYHVAPLLLDGHEYADECVEKLIQSIRDDVEERSNKGYIAHCIKLSEIIADMKGGRPIGLGKRPADLAEVLAYMAVASPAVCAYRTYKKYFDGFDSEHPDRPTRVAKAFINRMNTPESTAAIETCYGAGGEDAFWKNVLAYCFAGNFQATLDEYVHLLSSGVNDVKKAEDFLHGELVDSMSFRTTVYEADTFASFRSGLTEGKRDGTDNKGRKEKKIALRSHFAAAFTKGDGGDKDSDRKKSLRNAFNSPFRPFVLASTSIGQEGLDFHNYCRRIVHWNLPSNPIDLEQREGRINRYECLAIRQNVAKRYGDVAFSRDVWKEMFDEAKRRECTDGTSELVPFWSLTDSPDMIKIERVVPAYPFSRDEAAYERLMKILSLYRLTLGQARQEELVEYFLENRSGEDVGKWFINLSPYYKEKK